MGTAVTDENLEELINNATNVVWALDRDAFEKASKYAVKYRMYFGKSVPMLLDCDIKDMTGDQLQEVCKCLYGICSGR